MSNLDARGKLSEAIRQRDRRRVFLFMQQGSRPSFLQQKALEAWLSSKSTSSRDVAQLLGRSSRHGRAALLRVVPRGKMGKQLFRTMIECEKEQRVRGREPLYEPLLKNSNFQEDRVRLLLGIWRSTLTDSDISGVRQSLSLFLAWLQKLETLWPDVVAHEMKDWFHSLLQGKGEGDLLGRTESLLAGTLFSWHGFSDLERCSLWVKAAAYPGVFFRSMPGEICKIAPLECLEKGLPGWVVAREREGLLARPDIWKSTKALAKILVGDSRGADLSRILDPLSENERRGVLRSLLKDNPRSVAQCLEQFPRLGGCLEERDLLEMLKSPQADIRLVAIRQVGGGIELQPLLAP